MSPCCNNSRVRVEAIFKKGNPADAGTVHSRMDGAHPFRGSAAVQAGRLTQAALDGPRFRRVFPDVYVAAGVELDLVARSLAAAVLVGERAVLGGYSAAAVLGAPCGPPDTPAEVIVRGRRRPRPGLVVRDEEVPPDERRRLSGAIVTSPVRTALDIACRGSLIEAVVGIDALAHRFRFLPSEVMRCAYDHPGRRGAGRLPQLVRWAHPGAESPAQTRIRLGIVLAGLPAPEVQFRVGPYRLAMAYPELMLAVEPAERGGALRDPVREAHLAAAGWRRILRFDEETLLHEPELVPLTVRRELRLAAARAERIAGADDEPVAGGEP